MLENINSILQPMIAWLNTQRHLQAVKMSFVHAIPFLIGVGFVGMIQRYLQVEELYNVAILVFKFLPLFLAYDIGTQLGKEANQSDIHSGLICVSVCLMSSYEMFLSNSLDVYFPWIFISLLIGEAYRVVCKIRLKFPSIPSAVVEYFEMVLPFVFILGLGCVLSISATWWIPLLNNIGFMIVQMFDHIIAIMILVILTCMFWILGMHGVASIATITRPFWFYMFLANGTAYLTGMRLPYVTSEGFYQWFVWVGGSGATLGLVIIMRLFAKSNELKELSLKTIMGSCCNINEMIIFGTPIVMNRIMMIPFVLAPICAAIVNYGLIYNGYLPATAFLMPWVMPGPVGAFFASACSIQALLCSILTIVISCLIYLPFFYVYDQRLVRQKGTLK